MSCPGGTIGDITYLETPTCNGLCPEGYYCPIGSSKGIPCGSKEGNEYCPQGSNTPLIAPVGYYTTPHHKEISLGIRGGAQFQTDMKVCEGIVLSFTHHHKLKINPHPPLPHA